VTVTGAASSVQTQESPSPQRPTLWRRALAEFIGTGALVAIVVGSGIAAQRLSPNDLGLQLLENSLATTLGLAVLIVIFIHISGAHFNPIVTGVAAVLQRPDRGAAQITWYVIAQITGGICGAILANVMFDTATAIATTDRVSFGRIIAEVVATAGLILVIFVLVRADRRAYIGPAVGAYIGAAYWFTSSTAFANPAVTLGRVFSDTFAGIAPTSALMFIGAQVIGGAVGLGLVVLLTRTPAVREAGAVQRIGAS
jgi:glycerol uptake facilitator-like aquaporin